jgi:membrane protein DedA with SNARE-associated domain
MVSVLFDLTVLFKGVISAIGPFGIFLLMVVEGVITPIPSEIIMPFGGFLAAEGAFGPPIPAAFLVIVVGSLGAMVGSTGAYYLGLRLGRPFVLRYGRWFRMNAWHLTYAERWFAKYGDVGIFLGHALPGVRSFISFPAGMGKMRLRNFMAFTFGGALVWNTVLVLSGFVLGPRWEAFVATYQFADVVILAAVVAVFLGYIGWRRGWFRTRRRTVPADDPEESPRP